MAQRRMFSKTIVETDAFLDMPSSSQLLYFHLNMEADDDGFVSSPKKIMRIIGAKDDDYKILIAKRFILSFKNGVCVVKHWLIHNYIRKDTYTETKYIDEKNSLIIKENGSYTESQRSVDGSWTQVRLGKVRKDISTSSKEEDATIKSNNKKTMKKNTLRNPYNDKKHSDDYEDSIDIDTGEFNKPKENKKQKAINYIKDYFSSKCEKEIKIKPVLTYKHNIIIANLFNRNKMKPSEITDVIDWWFETEQDKTKLIQISNCLSSWNINKFKVAKN